MTILANAIHSFASLNRAPGATWTDATKRKAPHKPLLLLCLVSSLLAEGVIYRIAFFGQVACYAAAIFGIVRGERWPGWAALPAGVVVLNYAALVAMFHFLRGKDATWSK